MEPINFTATKNREDFSIIEDDEREFDGQLKRVSTEGDKKAAKYLRGYKTGGDISVDEYLKLGDEMRGSKDLQMLKQKANPIGAKIVKFT